MALFRFASLDKMILVYSENETRNRISLVSEVFMVFFSQEHEAS